MSCRALYAASGALVALGAPLGLLVLQAARAGHLSGAWLAEELKEQAAVHLYVATGTLIAFTLFGYVLGREGDKLARWRARTR